MAFRLKTVAYVFHWMISLKERRSHRQRGMAAPLHLALQLPLLPLRTAVSMSVSVSPTGSGGSGSAQTVSSRLVSLFLPFFSLFTRQPLTETDCKR